MVILRSFLGIGALNFNQLNVTLELVAFPSEFFTSQTIFTVFPGSLVRLVSSLRNCNVPFVVALKSA